MKDKPVILIVDDQPQNIELLDAYLVPQGYTIVKAVSGEEALEKLSGNTIDLILLDIMMPRMSGLEVLEKVHADKKIRLIPVVMVTALKETEDKMKALEAGCADFISKPVDKVELLARVKSLLKISYYLRQLEEKEKFKSVVDNISDGIAVCSPEYLIKDSNAALLTYLHIADPENVNLVETLFRNYSVFITKEVLMDLTIAHRKFDIVREETETIKALYLEVQADMIKNPSGELLSIVMVLRDVTEARRDELLRHNSLALVSHQLSIPLGVMSGAVALLQDGAYGRLNDEQKKAVETVSEQSSLLIAMVEKLLGFTIVSSHALHASVGQGLTNNNRLHK